MNKILNDEIMDNVSDVPTEAQRKSMKKQKEGLLAYKVSYPNSFESPLLEFSD
jgi:hypothetical protein